MRRLAVFSGCFSLAVLAVRHGAAPAALFALLPLIALPDGRRTRALLTLLGLLAGFAWCFVFDAARLEPARALEGRTERMEAVVLDWPAETDYGAALTVQVHIPEGGTVKTLLYAPSECLSLQPGDRLSAVAAFRSSRSIGNAETTLYTSNGIFLIGSLYGEITVTAREGLSARWWPQEAAKALHETITRITPPDVAPLMTALLTGEKDGLSDTLYSALKRTGLAHTVTVSGMQVSFLVTLLTLLLGRRRKLCAAVGLVLLVFFAALMGNTPSVLRAVFLHAAVLVAPLFGREADAPTSLCAVLMLLLLQNPYAAAGASLQLSFAAVAGMLLLSGPLYERWSARLPKQKVPAALGRLLLGSLSASLGAILFTTPLAAYHFETVCLIGPLSGLLALWAVNAAFLVGFLAVIAGLLLPVAGALLATVAALPVRYLLLLVSTLNRLPFASVPLSSVYYCFWLVLVYAALCLWLLPPEPQRPRWPVPVAVCTLSLCLALLFTGLTFRAGELTVTALDVGQGQSVVLSSGGVTALVDCGGTSYENPGDVAAGYLQSVGCTRLDFLILTHFHADHAGGVVQLLERMPVSTLLLPDTDPDAPLRPLILEAAARHGAEVRWIASDESFALGEAALHPFAPLGDGGANEEGLFLLCSVGDFDVLITGDANSEVELLLLGHAALPDLELLIVGHHGSKHSTSQALLDALTPELAFISVGRNSYGHPTDEVLWRLDERDIEIYRTDLMGTVTVQAR